VRHDLDTIVCPTDRHFAGKADCCQWCCMRTGRLRHALDLGAQSSLRPYSEWTLAATNATPWKSRKSTLNLVRLGQVELPISE